MSDVNLSIPSDLVKPIIEQKIQAAIVQEFGKSDDVLEKIVTIALNTKVDEKGQKSTYSYATPYIQWVCNNAIQESAQKALTEYVDQAKPKIVAAFKKTLSTRVDDIAAKMVDCFIENTKNAYNVKVDVTVSEKKRGY